MLGIGIYRLMKKITFIHISDVLLGALPDRECVWSGERKNEIYMTFEAVVARAGELREKYKGKHVEIHILTHASSGNCSQDCAYCAQSCRSKVDIDKYRWVGDEKLYRDNDFVDKYHLPRHCIGLSGMKFTDRAWRIR